MQTRCQECPAKELSFFCHLKPQNRELLNEIKKAKFYPAKSILFEQGAPSDGIFCITTGKIKLTKSDTQGHQKIVHIAGPGEMIGYRSMFADQPYQSTAQMIEKGEVCYINKKSFEGFLQKDPTILMNILKALAINLGQAQINELNMAHKPMDDRFVDLLVYLSQKYGRTVQGKTLIDLPLSRQEIADFIGSTQETAIRLIGKFKKMDVIEVDKKKIVIPSQERLHELACNA